MSPWVYNPHVGGIRIPPEVRRRTERRIHAYAEAHHGGQFNRLHLQSREIRTVNVQQRHVSGNARGGVRNGGDLSQRVVGNPPAENCELANMALEPSAPMST